jgi:hypothetical protein
MGEESLTWARTRISECREKHTRCAKRDEILLPTRILHISRTPKGAFEVILQESRGLRQKYACLSHRWGGSETGTTVKDTYTQKLDGIPWATIPRTFQDAIEFVYALGVCYLWIDSYCIIQDSPADWDAEAKQMASIFKNSYFTVAATAAINNEAGCFWVENGPDGRFLDPEGAEPSELSVRKTIRHWERIWTSNRESQFPLLTRAWVFQERVLAPRVLHFSHHELVWECAERGDCQCGGFDDRSNAKSLRWDMNNSWRSAVELYTSLRLTQQSDRLSAFHGFAEFYGSIVVAKVNTDYLAGLWKGSLHLDLLWRVDTLANISTEARPLCRCWDTEIRELIGSKQDNLEQAVTEQQFHRSCQYSYSAACSEACLQSKRLCRYGTKSAAIGLGTEIEGLSCVDWHQQKTNIPKLFMCDNEDLTTYHTERSPTSSWTWASAHQSVKYWTDARYDTRKGDSHPCQFRTDSDDVEDASSLEAYQKKKLGKGKQAIRDTSTGLEADETGSSQAPMRLKLNGHLVPAILKYQDIPIPGSSIDPQVSEQGTEGVCYSHNILKYVLSYDSVDLEFFPDYILCLDGPNFVPNHTRLYLLHVTGNAYLVLKETWFFDMPCQKRSMARLRLEEGLRYKYFLQEGRVQASIQEHADREKKRSKTPTKTAVGQHQESFKQGNLPIHGLSSKHRAGTASLDPYTQPALRERPQGTNTETVESTPLPGPSNNHTDQGFAFNNEVWDHASQSWESSYSTEHVQHLREKVQRFAREEEQRRLRLQNAYTSFRRIGVLRIPWNRADALHNNHHWIERIAIE